MKHQVLFSSKDISEKIKRCLLQILYGTLRVKTFGTPVAQWVKRWSTDLEVLSSSSARDDIFSTVNKVPLHTAFHY